MLRAAASPAEGDGDGEDGDGDKDDGEEEIAVWNLRRCSAAGLDMLSSSFGDELLPLLLPAVQVRLRGKGVSGGSQCGRSPKGSHGRLFFSAS